MIGMTKYKKITLVVRDSSTYDINRLESKTIFNAIIRKLNERKDLWTDVIEISMEDYEVD